VNATSFRAASTGAEGDEASEPCCEKTGMQRSSRTLAEPYVGKRTRCGGVMLIESTEHFHASAAIAIQRGPNEVAESDYESLPAATRKKLRILQEHGVVRLHSRVAAEDTAPNSERRLGARNA